jgi:RNA polymerase sigma-70 factor, ECF subfamily
MPGLVLKSGLCYEASPCQDALQRIPPACEMRFRVRSAIYPADTWPVIGAEFAVLLAQAQDRDEEAFARLYRDAQPALLRYLRVVAQEAPEDTAGDTWLHVAAGLAGFRGGELEFRAWLFTIARHRAVDAARARERRPHTIPLANCAPAEHLTAPDTADIAVERAATRATLTLVAALPQDQAEIIMLRVVAGLDTNTVARIVGKHPGAVRVASHRALRRLAAVVDRAGVL